MSVHIADALSGILRQLGVTYVALPRRFVDIESDVKHVKLFLRHLYIISIIAHQVTLCCAGYKPLADVSAIVDPGAFGLSP